MATYSAALLPTITHTYGALRPADIFDDPIPLNDPDGWLHLDGASSAYTSTQPVVENPSSRTGLGGFAASAGHIFYNRVQVTPSLIDLGNLLTVQARHVSLWNGFFTSKPLESLSWTNAEGVSIDSPVAIPSTLGPLQEVIYTVTAVTDGPSVIDAAFVWQVDGLDYGLRVIGNRVVVFPFLPDWRDGLEEQLAWMSSVERVFDGGEQRRELRNAARKTLTYDITVLDQHDAARIENMLFGWQARNFAVPIPTEKSKLTTGASLGTDVLNVDTTNLGFYDGQPALLRASDDDFEAIDVASVTASTLTLVRPLGRAWPAGTPVYPVGIAHLPNSQSLNRESDYYITASLDWAFAVTDANAHTPSAAAALTHRGQEVYLIKPDWSGKPSFGYEDAFWTFGGDDVGALEFDQTADFPAIVRQHQWSLRSRTDILAFRQFLNRRSGRVVPVWLPSWNSDFLITEDVSATAGGITVRDNGYRAFVDANAARRDIAIFLRGVATPLMMRITETADNLDGTVTLIFDDQVGTAFTVEQVTRISHMNLFRLGSDAVVLQWLTMNKVNVTLNWVLVKE